MIGCNTVNRSHGNRKQKLADGTVRELPTIWIEL